MSDSTMFLLLGILIWIPFDTFSQSPWTVDKSNDGIVVYTREEKDSDFKSFKAVMLVDAATTEIIRVLKDADSYTNWYGYTKTSKVLKRENHAQYNYVETIFPWPYNNRDMVYKMSVNTSKPEVAIISLKGISDYIPEKKGIVRMKKAEGRILLHSRSDGTEITYTFHSEPGDNVPVWLANSSIAKLPFKTLLGLRKTLKEQNKAER